MGIATEKAPLAVPATPPPAKEVKVVGLNKSFGSNQVLRGLDLTIPPGDFIGLMGPNGAGKSTLIKILDGVYRRSGGEITYGGERVADLGSRHDVGFVHQDLGLIDDLTVSDNLRLGSPPMRRLGPLLNRAREREAAERALGEVALVGTLAPAEKTLVAIARTLDQGARVLFVDEATSTLPPPDAARLIAALRLTASRGATVIMVSHKLSEILDATSRIVLLLDGRIVADSPSTELDRPALVSLLVRHERQRANEGGAGAGRRVTDSEGNELLRLEGVSGGLIRGVDLSVRSGQVLGLTGLPGSGLHDLAHLVHGTRRPSEGKVVRAKGVISGIVPPHRESEGGFAEQSTLDNLAISSLGRWRSALRLLASSGMRREGAEMIERLSINPPDPMTVFATLSGGNKQKTILGRVLMKRPGMYVLCEPTRGVDVSTRMEIYQLIEEIAESGAGVLIVSSDSEDLFAVCDRIAVVNGGRLSAFLAAEETNPDELEAFI
jgi:ribose transport system ATP-binding protein